MDRLGSIIMWLCFATIAYWARDAFWPVSPETRTFRGMAIPVTDSTSTYYVYGQMDTRAFCRASGRRPVRGEIVTISGPFLREQTREGKGPILVFRNCDVIHKWEEGGTIALSVATPCLPKASQISKVQRLLSERLENEATEFVNDVGGIWLDAGVSVYAGAVDAGSASITVKSTGRKCFVVARALSPATANSWEQRMPGTGRAAIGRDGLKYVRIPAGSFQMGCSAGDNQCDNNEKPAVRVALTKTFLMSETEVTQAAYARVMGTNPSWFKNTQGPVDRVSWNEAQGYCGKIGMRLPTEAEWEYAARGGSAEARYGQVGDIGWYDQNSGSKTQPVGKKPANGFGLHDMLGNVWEWTADWGGTLSGGSNPEGPQSGAAKILRGGSWDLDPAGLRVSVRVWVGPEIRSSYVGFRCVGE